MHLLLRKGRYHFNRRVPDEYRQFDTRDYVRFSLNTVHRSEALKRATLHNIELEQYWQTLHSTGQSHSESAYRDAVARASIFGFEYRPFHELLKIEFHKIAERLDFIEKNNFALPQVEAVLGTHAQPEITMLHALSLYWDFAKERIMNKSESQVRKYKRPRERAVENFIKVVGNKNISDLTREDILKFKNWWLGRIETDKMSMDSANKNFVQIKVIVETVSDNLQLNLNITGLFQKLVLKDRFVQTRLPLATPDILALLSNKEIARMNPQAYWSLFVLAETGIRPVELCGLLPEDIVLNDSIPHIHICDRPNRPLKTPQSDRKIPLVGYALDAFKAMPNGFEKYFDKADTMSATVNKFLREHKLLPSKMHSVYSLRHSFQDRILGVEAPDRVQAELMGHKFSRPMYGNGPSLIQKKEWLERIAIKVDS